MSMGHRAFKSAIYEQFARITKAIANPHRLELIDLLAQGERSVEELAAETDLSVANASQHLQVMREARLIRSRKEGLRVYYRLASADVFGLIQIIGQIAQTELAEVERLVHTYLSNRESLEALTANELLSRLHEPELVILDVRPALEYAHGHIAGARSIPIDELEARLGELSPEREIVAYCRGPYCVFADEAVDLLAGRGYRARRLQDGFPDWRAAGFPSETP